VYALDPESPGEGGGVRYVINLLKFLMRNKIDVALLGMKKNSGRLANKSNLEFIPIIENEEAWWAFFLGLFVRVPSLRFPDQTIIHVHRTYFALPFILFKKKHPIICTLHMKPLEFVKQEYPKCYGILKPLYELIDSFCLRRIHRFVAVNEDVKNAYEACFPFIKGKIAIIKGTGIDTTIFRSISRNRIREKRKISPDEKIILFVGRLEKIKNIDYLIRVMMILHRKNENVRLFIVGKGSEEVRLREFVRSIGLNDKIHFLGEVAEVELADIYNCCDAFALCSLSESSPTVVREAIACGLPVVTLNVGDVKKIAENMNLIKIVENHDEEDFADSLIEAINMDWEKREKLRTKASEFAAKEFGFEKIAIQYVEEYRDVIKNRD